MRSTIVVSIKSHKYLIFAVVYFNGLPDQWLKYFVCWEMNKKSTKWKIITQLQQIS